VQTPYKPQQFVWCKFPYIEEPLSPGPKEHVGYVLDIRQLEDSAYITVVLLYTTTAPLTEGAQLPLGVIAVDAALAKRMKQRPFFLDARKIAAIPANTEFFPRLQKPGKGIIDTASSTFHNQVQNTVAEIVKRPDLRKV
jgi:hypothetical protein